MRQGEGKSTNGGISRSTKRDNTRIRRYETLSLLFGILLIAASFFFIQGNWLTLEDPLAWIFLVVGITMVTITVHAIDRKKESILEHYFTSAADFLGVCNYQILLLLAGVFFAILAVLASGSGPLMKNAPVAVISWVLGIGLVISGGWDFNQKGLRISFKTIGLFFGFAALAFLIRAIDTTHIPPVLSGDEASSGLSAFLFLDGKSNNIFTTGWFSFPSLFFYLQSLPISLLGNTIPALRLLSALIGALTVGATFLLARTMFGAWAGIFAGIFLTGYHYHNHFSRIGLNNIWDGFWYTAVLGSFWLGWHKNKRVYFLLSGLFLGISQYFYISARILAILLLVWIGINFLIDSDKLKSLFPDIVLLILLALVAVLPLGIFYVRYPGEFSAPLRRVTIFGSWLINETERTGMPVWRILLRQVAIGYQGYVFVPIKMWYNPGTPLLRPASATILIFGILMLVLRARDQRLLMLLLWITPFGVIAGFSESTPAAQRYTAVAPALSIVIGYGLFESAEVIQHFWLRAGKFVNIGLLALLLVVSADELNFYYFKHTRSGEFGGENNLVAQRLADFLKEKESGWNVYFFGMPRMGYYSYSTLPYLASQVSGYDMNYPWGSDQNPPVIGDKITFVFLPNHRVELDEAQREYPGGALYEERNMDGELLYWLYEYTDEFHDSLR